jgi:hypothetical protein
VGEEHPPLAGNQNSLGVEKTWVKKNVNDSNVQKELRVENIIKSGSFIGAIVFLILAAFVPWWIPTHWIIITSRWEGVDISAIEIILGLIGLAVWLYIGGWIGRKIAELYLYLIKKKFE